MIIDADDFHIWVRPSAPCPTCVCCSRALCERAIERNSACHLEGGGSAYDLSKCPCWRESARARLNLAP